MLAVQVVGVYEAAIWFLKTATVDGQPSEYRDQ